MSSLGKNKPGPDTFHRQTGLEIKNIFTKAREFATKNATADEDLPIGWLIEFHDASGKLFSSITDLKPMQVVLSIYNQAGEKQTIKADWRHHLAENYRAELVVSELAGLDISGVEIIQHKKNDLAQFAFPTDAQAGNIALHVRDVPYGTKAISGLLDSLEAAYFDYETIMQIYLTGLHQAPGLDDDGESKLRFLFTGARVDYGDMAGTDHETERFEIWAQDVSITAPDVPDPSIISTLKLEAVRYFSELPESENKAGEEIPKRKFYVSENMYSPFSGKSAVVPMPSARLLSTCRRYWYDIQPGGAS